MLYQSLAIVSLLGSVLSKLPVLRPSSAAEVLNESSGALEESIAEQTWNAIDSIKGHSSIQFMSITSSVVASVEVSLVSQSIPTSTVLTTSSDLLSSTTASPSCTASVCSVSSVFIKPTVSTTAKTTSQFSFPSVWPHIRPFVGPNITTQIVVGGCGYNAGIGMQLSAEQMAVIPNCPNHYFSSEGHLIPLDNQSQNTQFNFTIASINSTCEGITSPFVLSAPGILENPFIANTWEIDCPTGRIWLSDRSLTFCTTNNPPGLVASVNASVCHMSTGSYASLSVFSSPIDYHLASQLSSTFMRKI